MKEFVIGEFERYLEIADTINTPFKFYSVEDSDVENCKVVKATVWLRSAFLTWECDVDLKEVDEKTKTLERHGFTQASIRETALPIK
ncbi:MAG: hypothetical protein QXF44_02465 [Candidatus Bathyarchaeia archaeon]